MKEYLMPMFAQIESTGSLFSWLIRITLGAMASLSMFATVSSEEEPVSITTSLVRPFSMYCSAYEVI